MTPEGLRVADLSGKLFAVGLLLGRAADGGEC